MLFCLPLNSEPFIQAKIQSKKQQQHQRKKNYNVCASIALCAFFSSLFSALFFFLFSFVVIQWARTNTITCRELVLWPRTRARFKHVHFWIRYVTPMIYARSRTRSLTRAFYWVLFCALLLPLLLLLYCVLLFFVYRTPHRAYCAYVAVLNCYIFHTLKRSSGPPTLVHTPMRERWTTTTMPIGLGQLFCYSIEFCCVSFFLVVAVSVTFRQSYRWDSDWQFYAIAHHV